MDSKNREFRGKVGDRLHRLERAKQRSDEMVSYLDFRAAFGGRDAEWCKKQIIAMQKCGAHLVFRDYFLNPDDVRLTNASFCRCYKSCGICAMARMGKNASAYREKVEHVVADGGAPFGVAHLVLTVPDDSDLPAAYLMLRQGMKTLTDRRRDYFKKGRGATQWRKFLGGVWSIEIGRGKNSGLWHPHVHMIVLLDSYVHIDLLTREWEEVTGGGHRNTNIGMIDEGAFIEVFKYTLKLHELNVQDNVEAWLYTRRLRLMGSFGNLRGVEVDENLADVLLGDASPFIDSVLDWTEGTHYEVTKQREGVEVTGMKSGVQEPLGKRFYSGKAKTWIPIG